MGWVGATLGAIFGSRFGLIGSLAGSVLGSGLGDALARRVDEACEQWRMEREARARMDARARARGGSRARAPIENEVLFLTALGAMFAKLAKADGRVDASEIAAGEAAFVRLGLTDEKRAFVIRAFRAAKTDAHSIFDYAASFASVTQAVALRELVYDLLWEIACADGVLAVEERDILEVITTPLRIRRTLFAEQYQRRIGARRSSETNRGWHRQESRQAPPRPAASDPYDVLGCARTASNDALRRAYRAQAKKLHPDILRAQGLPEELVSKANEQMARVNAAWREIKRQRGL